MVARVLLPCLSKYSSPILSLLTHPENGPEGPTNDALAARYTCEHCLTSEYEAIESVIGVDVSIKTL